MGGRPALGLDELHIRALDVQARVPRQAGDPRAAVAAADRLVRADPFLEEAHRLRIELLGEAGDRAGALKAYERCRTLLSSELHIEPLHPVRLVADAAAPGVSSSPRTPRANPRGAKRHSLLPGS